jgi:hypothetical protein
MQGQHVWHVKLRRVGQVDYEIAETLAHQRRAPVPGEPIKVIASRESVQAKVVSFETVTTGSKTKHTVLAAEDDDNPAGHGQATEKDFEP